MESTTSQNFAQYSLAMMRLWVWYQYNTTLFSSPCATTYRFVTMGPFQPGTPMVCLPVSTGSHPDPGRQFFGECGAWPYRCVLKYATKRKAKSVREGLTYTRLRVSSAFKTSWTSFSIGTSRDMAHPSNADGKRLSGGTRGVRSEREAVA